MTDRPQFYEIGQRLCEVREAFSGMNKSAWALKHGFGVTQYHNWEKGFRRIPIDDESPRARFFFTFGGSLWLTSTICESIVLPYRGGFHDHTSPHQ